MLITELKMLFHHLFPVCGILRVPGENRNVFSDICTIVISSAMHWWYICPYTIGPVGPSRVRTCLKFWVKFPAFISLFLLWAPHITCSTFPYLTLRTGFALSQTTLRLFEVFDLLCWSVSAVPGVRCCVWHWVLGAEQRNPELKRWSDLQMRF